MLTLAEAIEVLKAETIVSHGEHDMPLSGAFAADLMSDVLAFARPASLLITGLTTDQAIRTAAIRHLAGVVIVQGKTIGSDMIELASEEDIPLFSTPLSKYEACGLLIQAGLRPYRHTESAAGHGGDV